MRCGVAAAARSRHGVAKRSRTSVGSRRLCCLACLQRTLQFARDGFLSVFLPPTYPTHIWAYIQMTQVIAYEYLHQLQYTVIYIHVH